MYKIVLLHGFFTVLFFSLGISFLVAKMLGGGRFDFDLQFVQIISKVWVARFESLPFLGFSDNSGCLADLVHGVTCHDLPMVKDALGESLTSSI